METNTRLDIELYIMGEMKFEFMTFLGDCYKDNFFETLSWGNFRRFQLVLSNRGKWINVHFILLRNEMSADVLINSFKAYEKRSLTLLLYNANDVKAEKHIETVQEALIAERDKLYDGILSEESINKNLKRLSTELSNKNLKVSSDSMKTNLRYLADKQENLIYKVGLFPSSVNKRTKNVKKNDMSGSYHIESKVFYLGEEEACDFSELMCFLMGEISNKLDFDLGNFVDLVKKEKINSKSIDKKPKSDTLDYFVKSIHWLLLIYIVSCLLSMLLGN